MDVCCGGRMVMSLGGHSLVWMCVVVGCVLWWEDGHVFRRTFIGVDVCCGGRMVMSLGGHSLVWMCVVVGGWSCL